MIKKEQQVTLEGKDIIIPPRLGVFTLSRKLLLKAFYDDYSDIGLSLVELKKKLRNTMCENTLLLGMQFLKETNYITLVLRSVGPTRRRKYYKITELGAKIWEQNCR